MSRLRKNEKLFEDDLKKFNKIFAASDHERKPKL